jgi:hypothetical protein
MIDIVMTRRFDSMSIIAMLECAELPMYTSLQQVLS